MDTEHWTKAQKLFEQALDRDPGQRRAFLEEQCGNDQGLLADILALLAADDCADRLLSDLRDEAHEMVDDQTLSGREVGRYQALEHLDAGGMGEVYLAYDPRLKRQVALKFLAPMYVADETLRARLMREAQIAGGLNHPNIVTIYDIAEHDGRLFIAMEYITGKTLRRAMDEESPAIETAIEWILQILSGLRRAHSAGVTHRDLKPTNIMFDPDGFLKILDFGLAKTSASDKITQTGMAIGTANYMSPEQARGDAIDFRSDIFSLGILLYELLTGVKPFSRDNLPATVSAVVQDSIPPLERAAPRARLFQPVIDRATAKDCNDRFKSADEFIRDLKSRLSEYQGSTLRPQVGSAIPESRKPIAALYLKNLGDESDEHLCYGITEDLIIDLTKTGKFLVSPLQKILRLTGDDDSLREVSQRLGVRFLVTGSLRRSGNDIRLSVQLIDAETENNIWAERWNTTIEELPTLSQTLLENICEAFEMSSPLERGEDSSVAIPNPEAYEYYLRGRYAFERKKSASDVSIAIGLYRRAHALDSTLLSARIGAAEALLYSGNIEESISELQKIIQEPSASLKSHSSDVFSAQLMLARAFFNRAEWTEALSHCDQAARLARSNSDLPGEARAIGEAISCLAPQAKFEEALHKFKQFEQISSTLNELEIPAVTLKHIGTFYRQRADYVEAENFYREALRLSRKQEDLSLEADCLGNLGNVAMCIGDSHAALRQYESALDIYTRLGSQKWILVSLPNIAHIWAERGDYGRALEYLDRAGRLYDESSYTKIQSHINSARCEIYTKMGNFERAVEYATAEKAISEKIGFQAGICSGALHLGVTHWWQDNFTDASIYLHEALTIAQEKNLDRLNATVLLTFAEFRRYRNQHDVSLELLEESHKLCLKLKDSVMAARVEAYIITSEITAAPNENHLGKLKKLKALATTKHPVREGILFDRLIGEYLVKRSVSADDKDERDKGMEVLRVALATALSEGLAPEELWLGKLVADLAGSPS